MSILWKMCNLYYYKIYMTKIYVCNSKFFGTKFLSQGNVKSWLITPFSPTWTSFRSKGMENKIKDRQKKKTNKYINKCKLHQIIYTSDMTFRIQKQKQDTRSKDRCADIAILSRIGKRISPKEVLEQVRIVVRIFKII